MATLMKLLALLSIYSLYLSGVAADAQCNAGDRKALLKIKAGMTKDPSGALSSWGKVADCCNGNWSGVKCDADTGRVTKIRLKPSYPSNKSLYMVGMLSESVGDLTELFALKLPGWRNITGKIPDSIAQLQKLDQLDLAGNDFIGELPSWLPRLSKLRVLTLSRNRLQGVIPPAITTMSNLAVVELQENRITGTIPRAVGNLSRLGTVKLNNNLLNGTLPESIGSIQTLYYVELSHNALVGSIPSSFGNLSQLGYLYLSSNKLTGSIPASGLGSPGDWSKLSRVELQNN